MAVTFIIVLSIMALYFHQSMGQIDNGLDNFTDGPSRSDEYVLPAGSPTSINELLFVDLGEEHSNTEEVTDFPTSDFKDEVKMENKANENDMQTTELDNLNQKADNNSVRIDSILSLLNSVANRQKGASNLEQRMGAIEAEMKNVSDSLSAVTKWGPKIEKGESERGVLSYAFLSNVVAINNATIKLGTIESRVSNTAGLVANNSQIINNLVTRVEEVEMDRTMLAGLAERSEISERSIDPTTDKGFECGGILVQKSGVLEFEAAQVLPYSYTCVWTIRPDFYHSIKFNLLDANFDISKSKLRLTPIDNLVWGDSNINVKQTVWKDGVKTASIQLRAPVLLELTVDGSRNPVSPPKFNLTFAGVGDSKDWEHSKFSHVHSTSFKGSIGDMNYSANQDMFSTFVVVPKGSLVRFVTLFPTYMNMPQNLSDWCGDILIIWKIGAQEYMGSGARQYRICGLTPSQTFNTSASDTVGWVVVLRNFGGNKAGGFTMNYDTVLN